jgi:two-component system, NtrC family, sensor kinase
MAGAGGERRATLQREILTSLALVMLLSTAMLGAVLFTHQERSMRELVGRALIAEAVAPPAPHRSFVTGTRWWTLTKGDTVVPRNALADAIDADTRELGDRVREAGEPLLEPGPVWEAIRMGVPVEPRGTVALAVLPREASIRLRFAALGVLAAFLLADVAIFTALGAYLLRGRVVQPLEQLAAAARALAAGDAGVRAPLAGTRETAELGLAMNEMTDALERRTEALEKAVVELRGANRDLRQARQGLARAERLAAVGRLAAGVAHEVGNPIGAILALVDLAGRDAGLSETARGHLERAGREGVRVRTILRQLLDFGKPSRATPGPFDLATVAEQTRALVAAQKRYDRIDLRIEALAGTPTARGDAGAAGQILLNLLLNAGDAVQGAAEPRIRVTLRPAHAERRRGDSDGAPPPSRPPDAVECLVADNGSGIDPADRERIFDPFFTTKPAGEGTGLGLANAALLAEELDGQLELAAPPDGFTTAFALRLRAWSPPGSDGAFRAGSGVQAAADSASACVDEARSDPAAPRQSSSKPAH